MFKKTLLFVSIFALALAFAPATSQATVTGDSYVLYHSSTDFWPDGNVYGEYDSNAMAVYETSTDLWHLKGKVIKEANPHIAAFEKYMTSTQLWDQFDRMLGTN